MDQVDQLGRGHVYSGIDAKELKMVDIHGGLREAIADVRSRAGVPAKKDLDTRVFPRQRRLVDLILEAVGPDRGDKGLRAKLAARREAKESLPLALSAALARLPLSLLFLQPDQALTLLPGLIEIE